MYDTLEEIQQKLVNCLLIHNGKPFFVNSSEPTVNHGLCITGYYTEDKNQVVTRLPVSDPGLDIRNCGSRLGYMNLSSYSNKAYNECLYMMRMPRRSSQKTQGLSKDNVYVFGLRGDGTYDLPPTGNLNFDASIYISKSLELSKTFNNIYPSMQEIKDEFIKDSKLVSRAFHRAWAIRKDDLGLFDLLYKNIRVGYSEDLDRFSIPDRFRFHRSDLYELNINIS